MRITDTDLKENCENISAVLRHLCEDSEKKKELLKIVSDLPENEIKDIGFITTQLDDVIFALREKYINSSGAARDIQQKNCQMELCDA